MAQGNPAGGTGAPHPIGPPVKPQHIELWCGQHFGQHGSATPLAGEIDLNFKLTTNDGSRYVAKLAHSGEDRDALDFQSKALQHIASRGAGLPVPCVIPAGDGADVADVVTPSGERRMLRLMSWLDGTPLSEVRLNDATRSNVGALAACTALALQGFSHPAERRALKWDMTQAAALAPWLEVLRADLQSLPKLFFDRFITGFLPEISRFRSQVVHNDLNLFNLLVDPADETSVSGCIDFGDMVRVPLIIDLAVAAAYQADAKDAVGSIITMARAYHERLPLEPQELDWLVDLTAMRAAMTVIITHRTSRLDPGNAPYLLRNEPAARALLMALADVPQKTARERVRDEIRSRPA
jgi:hydroxylysine kinase